MSAVFSTSVTLLLLLIGGITATNLDLMDGTYDNFKLFCLVFFAATAAAANLLFARREK